MSRIHARGGENLGRLGPDIIDSCDPLSALQNRVWAGQGHHRKDRNQTRGKRFLPWPRHHRLRHFPTPSTPICFIFACFHGYRRTRCSITTRAPMYLTSPPAPPLGCTSSSSRQSPWSLPHRRRRNPILTATGLCLPSSQARHRRSVWRGGRPLCTSRRSNPA